MDRCFLYAVPEELRQKVKVGMRGLAPFGPANRETEGVIVALPSQEELEELKSKKDIKIKEILDIPDEEPFFRQEMLNLTRWIADYYISSWGEALRCATPAGVSTMSKRVVKMNDIPNRDNVLAELSEKAPRQTQILTTLDWEGEMSIQKLKTRLGDQGIYSALASLENKGLINISTEISKPRVKPKTAKAVKLARPISEIEGIAEDIKKRSPKQAAILEIMAYSEEKLMLASHLAKQAETTITPIKSLAKKGFVSIEEVEIFRDPLEGEIIDNSQHLKLNDEQEVALGEIRRSIDSDEASVFLLYGVTASGKTEVYMQTISRILEKGKGAIILVPEIALTPQTVFRFASRFGNRVTVLHSKMSQGERYDQWRRIKSGDVDIVVGARSAIFAPMPNLGLIVIDEEHETSYKQADSPRYHAREVALKRAELAKATVILGSATPAVESYYKASRKDYKLLTLPKRIDNAQMPVVEIVDMRSEFKDKNNRTIFSHSLREAVEDRLARGEQTILFLNRRGFATIVLCRECGYVARCENCDVSMTYHSASRALICHYCNFRQLAPSVCPICKSNYIRHFGTGTEKVEDETHKAFPEAVIDRMDADTTTTKGAHKRILDTFKKGEIDILIGTQMIAKGLDFPNVTLVGVITADTALNLPDFRAGERTFNLLTQVAGRSGRGEVAGEVIIQTYNPEHYSILAAQDHDYRSFYRQEIITRELIKYPPFTHVTTILLRGKSDTATQNAAKNLGSIIYSFQEAKFPDMEIQGPAPAPLARIKQYYRWHILLKAENPQEIRDIIKQVMGESVPEISRGDVIVSVDMDPMTVL
ncbi:primosomal protein N' [Candidatus Poribacteria bacterium]|nr:primosomal protein N' [Candidatus Poribacteria bacterium]